MENHVLVIFCLLSDIITDTINDLLNCDDWNHEDICSDYINNIPDEIRMDSKIPFAESKEFSIPFPDESSGKADVFVDDIISVTADVGDNLSRLKKAPCTVIHALAHKPSKPLRLKRDDMICGIKNQVEGAPAEEQICLGWILDSRRLLVV